MSQTEFRRPTYVPVGRALSVVMRALGPSIEFMDSDAAGRVVDALLAAGMLATTDVLSGNVAQSVELPTAGNS